MIPEKRKPPTLAINLLKLGIPRGQRDVLLGDLLERFDECQSTSWLWREVVAAVALSLGTSLRTHLMELIFAILGTAFLEFFWRTHLLRVVIWRSPLIQSPFAWSAMLPYPGSAISLFLFSVATHAAPVLLLLAMFATVGKRWGLVAIRNGTVAILLTMVAGELLFLGDLGFYGHFAEIGIYFLALVISAWHCPPKVREKSA